MFIPRWELVIVAPVIFVWAVYSIRLAHRSADTIFDLNDELVRLNRTIADLRRKIKNAPQPSSTINSN
jgi:hypothetical protein